MKRAGRAIKQGATEGPLEGVRWDCSWETAEAQGLFASVREACAARVGPPELTAEMVATALQEARELLDLLEEPIEIETVTVDPADEELADGWLSPGWRDAAEQYRVERGNRPATVELDPQELARLRRLLDDGISLERTCSEINANRLKGCAADSILKAIVFALRSRGVQALDEPDTRRRLSELSDNQLLEVAGRLQRLKPEIARAWTADEVETLIELRETLR